MTLLGFSDSFDDIKVRCGISNSVEGRSLKDGVLMEFGNDYPGQ